MLKKFADAKKVKVEVEAKETIKTNIRFSLVSALT